MHDYDRRRFLRHAAGGVIATAALPWAVPAPLRARTRADLSTLRHADPADEDFWQIVRNQFPIRQNLILLNAANLCPSPFPVSDTVTRLTRSVDADASFQNRAQFGTLREAAREALARYLGADPDEVAITRNTSEGNNTVINGLTLEPGDEVVIWDQNHPTCNIAWDVAAERRGFGVVRVGTPPLPTASDDLLTAFRAALTPRTRVLAFSHVSNVSGVALPARELCSLARDRDILTLVDGAQVFGALRLNLHDLGCDFYTGSAHKWFVGPKEAGVLYVRRERMTALWPSDVGVGWEEARQRGAVKFETLGQRDDACVAAMAPAVAFHEAVGIDRVEARIRSLAALLKAQLASRIPPVRFHTPREEALSAGVVVFSIPGHDARALFEALYREHGIAGAAMGGDFAGVRLCPHVYNTTEEIERAATIVAGMV